MASLSSPVSAGTARRQCAWGLDVTELTRLRRAIKPVDTAATTMSTRCPVVSSKRQRELAVLAARITLRDDLQVFGRLGRRGATQRLLCRDHLRGEWRVGRLGKSGNGRHVVSRAGRRGGAGGGAGRALREPDESDGAHPQAEERPGRQQQRQLEEVRGAAPGNDVPLQRALCEIRRRRGARKQRLPTRSVTATMSRQPPIEA